MSDSDSVEEERVESPDEEEEWCFRLLFFDFLFFGFLVDGLRRARVYTSPSELE